MGKINVGKLKQILKEEPNITQVELAKRFDCSVSTVYNALRKNKLRESQKRTFVTQEVIRMLKENPQMTYKQIEEATGCSDSAISATAIRMGIRKKADHKKREESVKKAIEEIKKNPEITNEEIARKLGLRTATLSHRLASAGINRRKDAISREEIRAYSEAHPEMSKIDISATLQVSYARVLNAQTNHQEKKICIDKEELREMMERKASLKEITERFGCSISAIEQAKNKILKPTQERKQPKHVPWVEIEKVMKEHPDWTIKRLAEELDIRTGTLSEKMRAHGFKRKPPRKLNYEELRKAFSEAKMTGKDLAKKYGVCENAIYAVKRKLGFTNGRGKS